ncbi:MAG: hypothetical protein AAF975_08385, partial [Spirochaetota bacterium]
MAVAKQIFALHILLGIASTALHAKEINNYRWRYSVNVLASWVPDASDDSGRKQVFRSPDSRLSLEIEAWERREVGNLNAMYTNHLRSLKGSGVVSRYNHMGYEVLLARIDYYSPQIPPAKSLQPDNKNLELEGRLDRPDGIEPSQRENNIVAYSFYFYGAQYAYRVVSIGPSNASSLERDIQYSVLDSFGFEGHNHWNWGPISSFFAERKQKRPPIFSRWNLGKHSF